MNEPRVTVMGGTPTVLNTWGKSHLLLQLLASQGFLPECHIYNGQGRYRDDGDEMYYVNGITAGKTEEEVTTSIWLLVDCWKRNGYLDDVYPVKAIAG